MNGLAIFDLDGTLLNTLEDLAEAMNNALTEHKFNIYPIEDYKVFAGNGIYKMIERALLRDDKNETNILKVKQSFDTYYQQHSMDHTEPYIGIVKLLEVLKARNIKIGVVSNKPNEYTKQLVKLIFGELIDLAIGQREGIPAKPNPQGVLEMIGHFNIRKEKCIYIGDSNVDIQTAKNAGIYSIGVLWGFRTKEELEKEGANQLASNTQELLEQIHNYMLK